MQRNFWKQLRQSTIFIYPNRDSDPKYQAENSSCNGNLTFNPFKPDWSSLVWPSVAVLVFVNAASYRPTVVFPASLLEHTADCDSRCQASGSKFAPGVSTHRCKQACVKQSSKSRPSSSEVEVPRRSTWSKSLNEQASPKNAS